MDSLSVGKRPISPLNFNKKISFKRLKSKTRDFVSNLQNSPSTVNLIDRLVNSQQLVQAGKTPYEVIFDNGLSRIRYYPTPAIYKSVAKKNIPLVIVAPLGINMLMYDLFPHRSFVQYMLSQGFDVYMLDWGSPTRSHADRNFASYVVDDMPRLLDQIKTHSHKPLLTLHGWSLGGLFTLLYSAYFNDPSIRNLIVLGSPIDSYKAGFLGTTSKRLKKVFQFSEKLSGWHPRKLPQQFWHTHGWMNMIGFKLLDPVSTIRSLINFLKRLDSRESVEAHATIGAFLNNMVDYPGGIIYDIANNIWLDNALFDGEYPLRNKKLSLKDIHQSILAVAGQDDGIVNPESITPIRTVTGSKDVELFTIPGGHLGIVSNEEVKTYLWPYMSEWLSKRDQLPEIGLSHQSYPITKILNENQAKLSNDDATLVAKLKNTT